jgi:hypothetical protein
LSPAAQAFIELATDVGAELTDRDLPGDVRFTGET